MTRHQAIQVYSYIESLYKEEINKVEMPQDRSESEMQMQITPLEGKILQMLLKAVKAKNVLEIGTLLGYSTLWLANEVGEDGQVTTIEKSEKTFLKASRFLEGHKNIKCIHADAVEYLKTVTITNKFDAVFIDADKTNYSNYFDLCLPLLRQGGLIIVDNTLMYGEVAGNMPGKFREKTLGAVRDFNQKISQSDLVDSIIIPTESGLTIAIKK